MENPEGKKEIDADKENAKQTLLNARELIGDEHFFELEVFQTVRREAEQMALEREMQVAMEVQGAGSGGGMEVDFGFDGAGLGGIGVFQQDQDMSLALALSRGVGDDGAAAGAAAGAVEAGGAAAAANQAGLDSDDELELLVGANKTKRRARRGRAGKQKEKRPEKWWSYGKDLPLSDRSKSVPELLLDLPEHLRPQKEKASHGKKTAAKSQQGEKQTNPLLAVLKYGTNLLQKIPQTSSNIFQQQERVFAFKRMEEIAAGNMAYFRNTIKEIVLQGGQGDAGEALMDEMECSVCMDDKPPTEFAMIKACAHIFCEACCEEMSRTYGACSMCRRELRYATYAQSVQNLASMVRDWNCCFDIDESGQERPKEGPGDPKKATMLYTK